jgi:glycosyltransferase involved in cell wall biosynthesis
MHTLLLTREMAALTYRTVLVAGVCEPADGDMNFRLRADDAVSWVPELSRSVRPWRNLQALWRLWRLLRRERPDIVHTHTAMAGCLGRLAAVLSGAPIIIHTFHGNSLSQYFSRFSAGAFRLIEQMLARAADVLCVVSAQQAEELSGKFHVAPRSKFRVVPLGLDLEPYFALPAPPEGPFTVGWFGRLVPVKNIPLLAETIEYTLCHDEEIRFVIAGDGPERGIIESLARRYPERVEWLGWQTDILPAMARCHAVLQTSRNEGTPVALIQAMAAARPFVSTAVGGLVDMVTGEVERAGGGARWHANGVLADADPAALAGALAELSRDRARLARMGREGAFAARQYRKEVLVGKVDALYRELLWKKNLGRKHERTDYRRSWLHRIAPGRALFGGRMAGGGAR